MLTLAQWLKFSFPNDPEMAVSQVCGDLKIDLARLRWLLDNPSSSCVVVAARLHHYDTMITIKGYTITIAEEPSGPSSTYHVDFVAARHAGRDTLDQPPH